MIRVGRGRTSVTLDGPLADGLEKEIRDVLGPVGEHLQAQAEAILEEARKKWPVKSGRSRDGWGTVLTVIPGTFEVEVSMLNKVRYVRYINSTKEGDRDLATRLRSPLQAHVRKPARAAKKALKVELPKVLAAQLNSSLEG